VTGPGVEIWGLEHWDALAAASPWKGVFGSIAAPVIAAQPYEYRHESDLHWTLGGVLEDAGIQLHHEVRLARGASIDFVTGEGTGIEIKVTGGPTDTGTRKQLLKYTGSGLVSAVLLITASYSHLRGKEAGAYHVPVVVLHIEARSNPAHEARYRPLRSGP
jgi:hypothetical protein